MQRNTCDIERDRVPTRAHHRAERLQHLRHVRLTGDPAFEHGSDGQGARMRMDPCPRGQARPRDVLRPPRQPTPEFILRIRPAVAPVQDPAQFLQRAKSHSMQAELQTGPQVDPGDKDMQVDAGAIAVQLGEPAQPVLSSRKQHGRQECDDLPDLIARGLIQGGERQDDRVISRTRTGVGRGRQGVHQVDELLRVAAQQLDPLAHPLPGISGCEEIRDRPGDGAQHRAMNAHHDAVSPADSVIEPVDLRARCSGRSRANWSFTAWSDSARRISSRTHRSRRHRSTSRAISSR